MGIHTNTIIMNEAVCPIAFFVPLGGDNSILFTMFFSFSLPRDVVKRRHQRLRFYHSRGRGLKSIHLYICTYTQAQCGTGDGLAVVPPGVGLSSRWRKWQEGELGRRKRFPLRNLTHGWSHRIFARVCVHTNLILPLFVYRRVFVVRGWR